MSQKRKIKQYMKKQKYLNVVFFDSNDLKVSVSVVNKKKLPDREMDMVKIGNDALTVSSSVFVQFSFKSKDSKYTTSYFSFPQLPSIRAIMNKIVASYTNELFQPTKLTEKLSLGTTSFGIDDNHLEFHTLPSDNLIIVELIDKNNNPIAGAPLSSEQFITLTNIVNDFSLSTMMLLGGLNYAEADDAAEPLPTRPEVPNPVIANEITPENRYSKYIKPKAELDWGKK